MLKIDVSTIALAISILSMIGGVISHFFIVVKKQVEMDTRLNQVENDVVELKKHIPQIEGRINDVHIIVTRMDAKQQVIFDQIKK